MRTWLSQTGYTRNSSQDSASDLEFEASSSVSESDSELDVPRSQRQDAHLLFDDLLNKHRDILERAVLNCLGAPLGQTWNGFKVVLNSSCLGNRDHENISAMELSQCAPRNTRGQKDKLKRNRLNENGENNDDGDDEEGPPRKHKKSPSIRDRSERFACPYYQRNSLAPTIRPSCHGSGFETISRLKFVPFQNIGSDI